jgi:hypothetical protein
MSASVRVKNCDSVIARGDPMPGIARAKESPIATPTIETLPLEERVRRRAYELYVQRGNQSGSEFDDWLQAEEEILQAQEAAINER